LCPGNGIILCVETGIEVAERAITRGELYVANEVFITGTAIEICPVSSTDGVRVGDGVRGALTKTIQKRYADLIRGHCERRPRGWLTALKTGQEAMSG